MQKIKYIIYFSLLFFAMRAQTNLIPNGSFESYTQCPFNFGQISFVNSWFNSNMADPDFYSACASSGTFSTPQNYLGYQIPISGNNYAGLSVLALDTGGIHTYGEYISVNLNQTLVASENYTLSFYIVMADSSEYAIKNMGAYFSNNDISNFGSFENFSYDPQITYSNFITDTINWLKITDSFIATGGEQYLTLGYFRDSTDVIDSMRMGYHPTFVDNIAYYFIDSVSLYKTSDLIGVKNLYAKQSIVRKDFYFNKSSTSYIDFSNLLESDYFELKVFDYSGKLIWINSNSETRWYGVDMHNQDCEEELYVYKIVNKNKIITGKISLTNN